MTLPFEDLEQVYELLAAAIDEAGEGRETLFLAKLALALAHELADPAKARSAIALALKDLPPQKTE